MIHVLKQVQNLPVDINSAWDYFNRAENLNDITPADLSFKICSELPEKVYPGLLIVYRIRVFKWISFEWVTEITHVHEPHFFVDEQRFGPYALWHHEHHFRPIPGGVEMTDIVHYKMPLGRLGNLFHGLLIKPKLEKIFSYRKKALEKKFGRLD